MINEIHFGDCRESLRAMAAAGVRVQTCVTSPPYFGLRSYDENSVRIDPALPEEKRQWLLAELEKRGVYARA
jgi:site-specific DNA-methyltransferase (cytosine-N4-specific)